jgi:hypothetical protein
MSYWEFLLQKEGDRTWYPISTSEEYLEEGKYRIVAHSDRINADVEIRVTYNKIDGDKVLKRSQKRSRHTNGDGLIVILPFTYLYPGLWELRCYNGNLIDDFVGEAWKEKVNLQVLAKVVEFEDYIKPSQSLLEENNPQSAIKIKENDDNINIIENNPVIVADNLFGTVQDRESQTEVKTNDNLTNDLEEKHPVIIIDDLFGDGENQQVIDQLLTKYLTVETETQAITPLDVDDLSITNYLEAETEEVYHLENLENLENNINLINNLGETETQEITPFVDNGDNFNLIDDLTTENRDQTQNSETITLEKYSNLDDNLTTENLDQTETSETINLENNLNLIDNLTPENLSKTEPELENNITEINRNFSQNTDSIKSQESQVNIIEINNNNLIDTQTLLEASLKDLEQILQEEVTDILPEETLPEPELTSISEPKNSSQYQEQFEIILTQDTFIWHRGQALLIAGQINAKDNKDLTILTSGAKGKLRYEGRDPQTGELLFNVTHSLEHNDLPLLFSHLLEIPETVKTHVILGEIFLEISLAEASQGMIVAYQTFNLTAALDDLLASFSQNFPDQENIFLEETPLQDQETAIKTIIPQLQTEETETKPPLKLEFLQFINQEKGQPNFKPASSQILPPKITNSTTPKKQVDLPDFIKIAEQKYLESLKLESKSAETSLDQETEKEVNPETTENQNNIVESEVEIKQPTDPFDTLNLEERFLSRLNIIASDPEASELLREEEVEEVEEIEEIEEIESEVTIAEIQIIENTVIEGEIVTESETELEIELSEEAKLVEALLEIEEETSLETVDPEEVEEILNAEIEIDDWEQAIEALIGQVNPLETTPEAEEASDLVEELEQDQPLLKVAADWNSLEVVVEEEIEIPEEPDPSLMKRDTSGLPYPKDVISSRRENTEEILPLSVPEPIISINKQKLISGEQAIVYLQLPFYPGSVYLKLWIQDRQTRTLLEGPWGLTDLVVTPEGNLETMTQITIPFGSMEMRFEAIAIDPETQKESHKVGLDCVVFPPELEENDLSFEDLEF